MFKIKYLWRSKYYFGVLVTATVLLSCKNSSEQRTHQSSGTGLTSPVKIGQAVGTKEAEPKPAIEESSNENNGESTDYLTSINFDKYPADPQKRRSNALINWDSNVGAKSFKTRIDRAYKENDVSFAGYYIVSTFGCGASCVMGFMVDVRDGKIYDLPLGEENSCLFAVDGVLCKSISRLFVSGVCKESVDAKKVFYKAYLWDEENKKFNPVKENEFLK